MNLAFASATQIADLVRARQVSVGEIVDFYLDRIATLNPKIRLWNSSMMVSSSGQFDQRVGQTEAPDEHGNGQYGQKDGQQQDLLELELPA